MSDFMSNHASELELIADILLNLAGRDPEYPAYSERRLSRKACCPPSPARLGWTRYSHDDLLLESELEDMVDSAGLLADERCAWMMHLEGRTNAEIAAALGTTCPTAKRLIHSAANRVASCRPRYQGLYETYISQVRRRHSAPVARHCD